MYLDGSLIKSNTGMGNMVMADYENTEQDFYVMAHNNEGSVFRPTDGLCTEVALWKGVLPDAGAVLTLYNAGVPVDLRYAGGNYTPAHAAGLWAYWPMNENTASTANDYSSNSYNGTLTNGATWSSTRPL